MNDKSQLTIEEIKEELKALRDVENGTGFLYFCLNYVKVSHPSRGSVALHEDMYKWQKNACRDFISKKQIISKKTRQTGFSTLTACYALYRALFFEAQNIVIVSLTQRESTDLLRRVKFTYDHLPIWLKQPTDEFAKTTLSFSHNGSKVTAVPRSSDAGRGGSISLLIIDEFGAMDQQKALLASALPALSAGLLTPFTNKTLPSQLFVISTLPQNPVDNEYLRLFHYAQDNPTESKFHLIDVDTSDIPQYQDPEWHATMRESLGDRIYKIEILGQEVYDMENSLIPGYILEKIDPQSPIRTDFLYSEDIDEEGYYKDFSKMLEMNDDFDDRYGYVKGLWVWRDPVPGKQYVAVCLPTGEKVLTNNGLKNIESVEATTDMLYSKDGNETKIIKKIKHKVKDKPIYTLQVENIYNTTTFTEEHPILASKSKIIRPGKLSYNPRTWKHDFKFYPVQELKKGDWLCYPNIYNIEKISEETMIKKFEQYQSKRYDFNIDSNFILDEDAWWYIGLWIAEGHIAKTGKAIKYDCKITTSHNLTSELYLVEKISNLFNKYNRKICATKKPTENSLAIHLSTRQLASFLTDNFGEGAANKQIPEWIKFIPRKYKIQLIKGYLLGDGSIINNFNADVKKKYFRSSFVSVSLKLLQDVQDIIFSLGIVSNLKLLRKANSKATILGRTVNQKETYYLNIETYENIKLMNLLNIPIKIMPTPKIRKSIGCCYLSEDNKYIYLKVSENIKSSYTGEVYNFETEDHTYCCNYIPTHNCDVATGRANDFSTILVMDPEDNSQVAEYRGKIDTERLKRVIELICQHWNDAKLSIESTGLGGPVTEYFATTTMYPGLYWHRKNKKELTPGFPMSVTNRANALAIMQTMIVKSEIKIMSVRLLNELRGFGYTKAGRLEALAGHDDLVMALTQYCFLNNVGFAATDRMVTHRLMFGDVVEEINVENAVLENKVKKYWQDAGYTIDDETAELLAIAEANGCSLADLDVAHIVATWKD
ncbi:MAG TPA: LAGLIDADG family homing endonuclease [Clostridia bacterium]|nr:LAGLIDADG family homing endonuclease [Clostridia bacterium]